MELPEVIEHLEQITNREYWLHQGGLKPVFILVPHKLVKAVEGLFIASQPKFKYKILSEETIFTLSSLTPFDLLMPGENTIVQKRMGINE